MKEIIKKCVAQRALELLILLAISERGLEQAREDRRADPGRRVPALGAVEAVRDGARAAADRVRAHGDVLSRDRGALSDNEHPGCSCANAALSL